MCASPASVSPCTWRLCAHSSLPGLAITSARLAGNILNFRLSGGGGAEHPNLGGIWPLQDSAPTGARGKASASVGVYFFHPVEEMPEEKGNY